MAKKKIVYLSSNDGTDTRINKEVRTLSTTFDVFYIGVTEDGRDSGFLKEYCFSTHSIVGKRNHPMTLLKQIVSFIKIISSHRVHSIHVVNEQLMIFYWPFLFFYHVVLDVFDSIFLRINIHRNKWTLFKKLVYAPCNKIIVTDDVRRDLMPDFLQNNLAVLPNYPFRYTGPISHNSSKETLTVLFFGWLGMTRGGSIAKGLLESNDKVNIIMLGWFVDDECRQLTEHPHVDYRGVIPQINALEIAATEADYILCLYEPLNQNMINASPNKIYDGIQTETPLLINKEVTAASLVENLNIGIVIPTYYPEDFRSLANLLLKSKKNFDFSNVLKEKYTWESIEDVLLSCHQS